jgi:HSP20 family protein
MDMRSLMPTGWRAPRSLHRFSEEEPFERLHHEIDQLFDDLFRTNGPIRWPGERRVTLPLEVRETDKELVITAELPGVEEKDVEVTLSEDMMTIKGEKKTEKEVEKEGYYMAERSYGTFSRSLRLPYRVDEKKVVAKFKNGVLTIALPKPKEARETVKKIAIKTAA